MQQQRQITKMPYRGLRRLFELRGSADGRTDSNGADGGVRSSWLFGNLEMVATGHPSPLENQRKIQMQGCNAGLGFLEKFLRS